MFVLVLIKSRQRGRRDGSGSGSGSHRIVSFFQSLFSSFFFFFFDAVHGADGRSLFVVCGNGHRYRYAKLLRIMAWHKQTNTHTEHTRHVDPMNTNK